MRRGILALALGLTSGQVLAAEMPPKPAGADGKPARGDFVSFHERAAALTPAGGGRAPDLARYGIGCSLEMPSGGYFTLARTDDGRAALFVWTDRGPVRALEKVISFGDQPEKSLSWGWLYDRNGDGSVDYFTLADGAMPVISEEIAHLVPRRPGVKRGDPIKIESAEELRLLISNVQLVFTHHADDDFDGRSDAVVAALWYPENPAWIYRYGVLRSRAFTQAIDESWSFVSHIGTKAGSVPGEDGDFQVSFFREGARALETSSRLLAAINDGIRACRIPKGDLPGR